MAVSLRDGYRDPGSRALLVAAVIHVTELTYCYPRKDAPALSELNLEIPPGQFVAVIGANGAGKSSLCYALTGFIPHFFRGNLSGTIEVHGRNVPETPLADLAGDIGLVFSNPFNQITGAKFTVREEIAFGLENIGLSREDMLHQTDQVLAMTGLTNLAERSPFALSGGQQQRLAIASVLAMEPRVLVLDEPTSQLDPAGTREVFAVLRTLAAAGETTVILAEHKLEWVAVFADRILVLQEGRLVADGSPEEVLSSTKLPSFGLSPTRYTIAARQAFDRDLVKNHADVSRPLPVTLEQTAKFFA
jgi:energy-coupling factor transport system ATP-binding protein